MSENAQKLTCSYTTCQSSYAPTSPHHHPSLKNASRLFGWIMFMTNSPSIIISQLDPSKTRLWGAETVFISECLFIIVSLDPGQSALRKHAPNCRAAPSELPPQALQPTRQHEHELLARGNMGVGYWPGLKDTSRPPKHRVRLHSARSPPTQKFPVPSFLLAQLDTPQLRHTGV